MNRREHLLSIVLLSVTAHSAWAQGDRWYSSEQVAKGKPLYAQSCAVCHGQQGEAGPGWAEANDQGQYPPPPLNGSAHTWHHSLDALRYTVREGGGRTGGSMPAFGGVLTGEDIDAVLAYVQSLWPDEIYAVWAEANPGAAPAPAASGSGGERTITEQLSKLLPPGTEIGAPQATPVSGVYEVKAGGQYVYIDHSGRYGFVGNLIDLGTGESLTEAKRAAERASKVNAFEDSGKIIFKANGEQKAHIDVFTDTTCPYCRKLHAEVSELQAAGITVRYLAFPRGGENSQGDRELRSVWCAPDPVQAMHQAKLQSIIPENDGTCRAAEHVAQGYRLGIALGVRGTPAIVLPDGVMIPGYRPHGEIIASLGAKTDRQ